MALQIIGSAKCKDTKKCRLWFDARGISYHFVDLSKRGLSSGELNAIAARNSWDDMLDRKGKSWVKRQLEWKEFNPEEELTADPMLLKTPVVRNGYDVVIGYSPDSWVRFAEK